jgi:hypothetical protein
MKAAMREQTAIPWDDWSDADRAAAIELWWTKASPEPGTDEYLILQWMSGGVADHGDPEAASKELCERGLIELRDEHRLDCSERGRAVSLNFLDRMTRIHDMSTAEPTPEGIQRHPPDGYFRTDFFDEPVCEPCTCSADCPKWCEGRAVARHARPVSRSMAHRVPCMARCSGQAAIAVCS